MSRFRRGLILHRWLWFLTGPLAYEHFWLPFIEASHERRRQQRRSAA